MARDNPRHQPPKRQSAPQQSFDDEAYDKTAWRRDLEQRLEEDRNRMLRTHHNFYAQNNVTGLDLVALSRDDQDYPPYYDRDYTAQGYSRNHDLEHDPNYGRGQAYRYDYGREQYGREAYRDNYNPSRHTGPDYRGRGPKGYQRSDRHLLEDVCERLSDDPRVDASDIEVSVSKGEITLSGTVDSRASKKMAEYIVESCTGVKDVHNQLRIAPAGESDSAQINM